MIDVEKYEWDGYLVVRSVLDPTEVAKYRTEIERLTHVFAANPKRHGVRVSWHGGPDDPARQVKDIEPLVDMSDLFAVLVTDTRVTTPVEAIFADTVSLFEDKLRAKPPGGSGFDWHQDWSCCWRAHTDELITCFVSLDDANEENGALQVVPGSHRPRQCFPFYGDMKFGVDPKYVDVRKAVMPPLNAGDMIVFDPYLLHYSGANKSDEWRRTIIYTYAPGRLGDVYHYDTSSGEVRWVDDLYYYDNDTPEKWVRRNDADLVSTPSRSTSRAAAISSI
jgi:2-aminoethylphosphonate dioxygenase